MVAYCASCGAMKAEKYLAFDQAHLLLPLKEEKA